MNIVSNRKRKPLAREQQASVSYNYAGQGTVVIRLAGEDRDDGSSERITIYVTQSELVATLTLVDNGKLYRALIATRAFGF